jgi:outer membrane protein TolC
MSIRTIVRWPAGWTVLPEIVAPFAAAIAFALPSQVLSAPPISAAQLPATGVAADVTAAYDAPISAFVELPPVPAIAGPDQYAELILSQPLAVGLASAPVTPAQETAEILPPGMSDATECVYPIDLPSALALGGANNLQIAIAAERVNQAAARLAGARALWIPSLSAGAVYNNHAGRIQATEGEVLEASRSSLFVGGGAAVGNSPMNGGASGPARMFVDLSLVDAYFEPLSARQLVRASAADRNATFNDTLLQVGAAYLSLARAQARIAIAEEAVRHADELARITGNFADSGQGLQADADRAKVEAASRRRDVWQAREDAAVISAELARLLRLDSTVQLVVADNNPAPLDFVDPTFPLGALVGQAIAARPELASADAQRDAAALRSRQEQLRPWVPHLYAGASSGGFGGSDGSDIDSFSGRADFDVAALWQVQNLGFGNAALRREQQSLTRQASFVVQQTRDLIAAEVTQAYQRIQMRGRQIEVTRPPVESAVQAVGLNMEGIRAGELRPIEIQQAIGALAAARVQYLDAVTDYNAAQMQLLRAVGRTPEMDYVD